MPISIIAVNGRFFIRAMADCRTPVLHDPSSVRDLHNFVAVRRYPARRSFAACRDYGCRYRKFVPRTLMSNDGTESAGKYDHLPRNDVLMIQNPVTILAIVAIVLAVVAIAVAIWALQEVRKIRHLRTKFGPEYDRTLRRKGDAQHAARVLEARARRVSRYQIRSLTPPEIDRFTSE